MTYLSLSSLLLPLILRRRFILPLPLVNALRRLIRMDIEKDRCGKRIYKITFAGPTKGAGCSALRFKFVPAIVTGWAFGGSSGE